MAGDHDLSFLVQRSGQHSNYVHDLHVAEYTLLLLDPIGIEAHLKTGIVAFELVENPAAGRAESAREVGSVRIEGTSLENLSLFLDVGGSLPRKLHPHLLY